MANLTQELIQNIDSALYLWEAITLKELIEFYPIKKMAEVYTYLQIACNSSSHKVVMEEETIVLKANGSERISEVTMPTITFSRSEANLVDAARRFGQHVDFASVSKLKVRHISVAE